MRHRIVVLVFTGVFGLGLAAGASGDKAPSKSASSKAFPEISTETLKSRVEAGKSVSARLKALNAFKRELSRKEKALTPEIFEKNREAASYLIDLGVYLKNIPEKPFPEKDCTKLRDRVIFGFSPKDDHPSPDEIPRAAKDTLDLLARVCANPELARIPAPTAE